MKMREINICEPRVGGTGNNGNDDGRGEGRTDERKKTDRRMNDGTEKRESGKAQNLV